MKMAGNFRYDFIALCLLCFSLNGFAHQQSHQKSVQVSESKNQKQILATLSQLYQKDIEPIFQKKCFDCHSSQTREPWYRNWPGAKQLIDRDIQEAQEHLKMDAGFPFESHSTPLEDLASIKESIIQGEMPPLRYRILHWNSKLTKAEELKVLDWTQIGLEKLKNQ